jgi:hypothetical protein
MDDDAIRALVTRLARPHTSGGNVVERAAILAEGADSAKVLTWISAHAGEAEAAAPAAARGGLHGARVNERRAGSAGGEPQRYVLPPGVLGV